MSFFLLYLTLGAAGTCLLYYRRPDLLAEVQAMNEEISGFAIGIFLGGTLLGPTAFVSMGYGLIHRRINTWRWRCFERQLHARKIIPCPCADCFPINGEEPATVNKVRQRHAGACEENPMTMKLSSWDDVVSNILPLAPGMVESDLKDIVLAVAANPAATDALEADYRAANAALGPDVLGIIWGIILEASQVAGIVTSLAGAVALV